MLICEYPEDCPDKVFVESNFFFSNHAFENPKRQFCVNPNPEKCQFARNFLATFFEVSQKRGCQVAMMNEPICQGSFSSENRWQLGFSSKLNN
jgi:hypothetical protein